MNWRGQRIVHVAEVTIRGLHHAVDHSCRAPGDGESNRVEGNGHQRSQTDVDQVSRGHIAPIRSPSDEDGLLARFKGPHDDLRVVPEIRPFRDREDHGAAAGQHVGQPVTVLARLKGRERLGSTSRRRHTPQAPVSGGRKHNGAVAAPARPEERRCLAQRHRRSATERNLPELALPPKSRPIDRRARRRDCFRRSCPSIGVALSWSIARAYSC